MEENWLAIFNAKQAQAQPGQTLNDHHEEFSQVLSQHKLTTDEYAKIKNILGRSPTYAELGVFSAMWSEHCSYKSSRIHFKKFPTTGAHVVQGPGENAGIVRLFDKLCLAFKMESHNHPSYIEPYQGAATGVGGILRDVFCMGARPIANLNSLRFGAKTHARTSFLFEHATRGIGDYGNCVGIPTVGGSLAFDETYNGNCLVNAMSVGLIHEDHIFRGYAQGSGNLLVYVGSATGRDGVHGATMASDSFRSQQSEDRSAVQVGDPFMEKLLLEATLEALQHGLVVGLQDMGAAGLCSSSFEMAARAGQGLYIDLDAVPVRTQNLSAYELLLSESQERMLMVVEPHQWGKLKQIFDKWLLSSQVIGVVTDSLKVEATYQGRWEVQLPVRPVSDQAPLYHRPHKKRPRAINVQVVEKNLASQVEDTQQDIEQDLIAMFKAQQKAWRQYDRHIGTQTVLDSEHGGAALLWLRDQLVPKQPKYLGVALATACSHRRCALNAHQGACYAVLKAARMIAAVGARPLAITDCLNFGNPEDPYIMQEFVDAIEGIAEACTQLNTPVVSGNVSFYNETDHQSIEPTPMIGMVGIHNDVRVARPARLRRSQNNKEKLFIYWLSETTPHFSFVQGPMLTRSGYGARDLAVTNDDMPINWVFEKQAINKLVDNPSADFLASVVAVREVGCWGVHGSLKKMLLHSPYHMTDFSWDFTPVNQWAETTGYLVVLTEAIADDQQANEHIRWRYVAQIEQQDE